MNRCVLFLGFGFLFGLCFLEGKSSVTAFPSQEVEALRVEVGDLRHLLNGLQTDLTILEEKVRLPHANADLHSIKQQIALMQSQCSFLANKQEKVITEYKHLSDQLSQLFALVNKQGDLLKEMRQKQTAELSQHLEEILQIKKKLLSTIKNLSPPSDSLRTYRVRPGDTLEKIARREEISLERLKELNQLSSDTIFIDQLLKLP
jgi:LysM repeat protein